jgi:hypothetical protein
VSQAVTREDSEKISRACKLIFDDLEDVVSQMRDFKSPPHIRDDYDVLHMQLLFYSATEGELTSLYVSALQLKYQVDTRLLRAKETLEDAKMAALEDRGVRIPNQYQSRVEIDAKLRSKTFEENYDVKIWESSQLEVKYLIDVIKTYQSEASRMRRDVDARTKLKGLQF